MGNAPQSEGIVLQKIDRKVWDRKLHTKTLLYLQRGAENGHYPMHCQSICNYKVFNAYILCTLDIIIYNIDNRYRLETKCQIILIEIQIKMSYIKKTTGKTQIYRKNQHFPKCWIENYKYQFVSVNLNSYYL